MSPQLLAWVVFLEYCSTSARLGLAAFQGWSGVHLGGLLHWVGVQLGLHFLLLFWEVLFGSAVGRLGLCGFLGWSGAFWLVWVGVQLGLHFLLLGREVQFGSAA